MKDFMKRRNQRVPHNGNVICVVKKWIKYSKLVILLKNIPLPIPINKNFNVLVAL
jgi:hypothetical protein